MTNNKEKSTIEQRFKNVSSSKTFNNIVEHLELNNKSVLDIECSYGEYLEHFGKGSVGLTISRKESEFGKERGLDIRYGNIESEDLPIKEKFDVIFANNIFEHLYSPHKFLIDIKKFLKSDSVFILGVPCIPKIVFLLHIKKFKGSLAVSHINFFTRDTLIKTVERSGWNIKFTRSFHFKNRFFDKILDIIEPHIFVIVNIDYDFKYDKKRIQELEAIKLNYK